MSERSFDDLARRLAAPMPRRRALKLAGAAFVAAAVPGLRASRALASPCGPDTPCSSVCKTPPDIGACGVDTTNGCGQVGCRLEGCLSPGEKCCRGGSGAGETAWICKDNERCGSLDGPHCVSCPEGRMCGKECCRNGEFCASRNRELCCKDGEDACLVPNSPKGVCCPRDQKCCFNGKRAECCGQDQSCRRGTCVCKDGQQACGPDCCRKGETCSKGKCCPKRRVNCGDGECCKDKSDCCGETCCNGKRETCVGGSSGRVCCQPSRMLGRGRSARCCPSGTVATADGCCPVSDLNCCSDETLACLGKAVCVRGRCKSL
jgi:hypothetical protein